VSFDSDDLPVDAEALALRVRGLIGMEECWAAARRLGVSAQSLEMTARRDAPRPNLAVLVAIVQKYGVDPMWLLTGHYDLATHWQALDDDNTSVADIIHRVARQRRTFRAAGELNGSSSSDSGSRAPLTSPETDPHA
jgi:hypothetical protein